MKSTEHTAPLRALGYIRVSTKEQAANGHSVDQQGDRIRAWCVARGLELVALVDDAGVSGGKPLDRRPGGAELLARMAAGEADVVVVVAIDRLFRDAQDGLNTMLGQGRIAGMPVQSVSEPIDTTSAMGRFILTVWLARAQLEREQTCERNTAIARGLRAAGKPNGTTPYGCVTAGGQLVDGRRVGQRLYRDPATWPARERIVQLRAEGLSFAAIRAELARLRVPSPTGEPAWGKSSIKLVCDTHLGLNHIPPLPAPHETAVSEAAHA